MGKHLQTHGEKIVAKLLEGRYPPAAVRAVEIPKASGGRRLLGIPTVIDRMIQQAIHQAMGPTFEEGFSKSSRELREQWQNHIRGWWNYFQLADWRREVEDLSGWIRPHMRKCFWLRWHHPKGRINALKRLGVKGRSLGTNPVAGNPAVSREHPVQSRGGTAADGDSPNSSR